MRWGSARLRFARPIRWLLAAFDGAPSSLDIQGVPAGVEARGHRFYAPDAFHAVTFEGLVDGLRRERSNLMSSRAQPRFKPSPSGCRWRPVLPDDLVDENAFLTEWPTAIAGEFRTEHLGLPESVLTTAMAKLKGCFLSETAKAELLNRFVFIRNSGEDDSVRRGAEWVLNARLDDAQFSSVRMPSTTWITSWKRLRASFFRRSWVRFGSGSWARGIGTAHSRGHGSGRG